MALAVDSFIYFANIRPDYKVTLEFLTRKELQVKWGFQDYSEESFHISR